MPQLLLIKDANTIQKKVGDIIGVFEDPHKFSDDEKSYFYIEYVAGFKDARELKIALRENHYEIKRANRLPVGNQWTFTKPEEKEFWRELPDGKWCELVDKPKYKINYYALTPEERQEMAKDELTMPQRIELLRKCENRIKTKPENLKEEPHLNLQAIPI